MIIQERKCPLCRGPVDAIECERANGVMEAVTLPVQVCSENTLQVLTLHTQTLARKSWSIARRADSSLGRGHAKFTRRISAFQRAQRPPFDAHRTMQIAFLSDFRWEDSDDVDSWLDEADLRALNEMGVLEPRGSGSMIEWITVDSGDDDDEESEVRGYYDLTWTDISRT